MHLPNGFSTVMLKSVTANGAEFGAPGYEMSLLYTAVLLALALGGPEVVSADNLMRARKAEADGDYRR